MGSLNKVMLIGNLGADPEIRRTQSGQVVATLRLATNERWGDRDGNQQERTEWHRVIAWGRLAEVSEQYLRKGRQVYVEGRLQTRQWQDQEGKTRYSTEVVAQNLQMLGSRGAGGEPDMERDRGAMPAGVSRTAVPEGQPEYDDSGPVGQGDDSDLPF
ncbi:MAG: single-stranded DNA-binding protein [Candidatus Eisenbacteria bacterium]|nr:single-stranded DNA-binding protein [Candidatus Eisenbacteria bacterium]